MRARAEGGVFDAGARGGESPRSRNVPIVALLVSQVVTLLVSQLPIASLNVSF